MNHEHYADIFIQADGSEEHREPWVVHNGHETLTGTHSGGVCIHAGASFEIGSRGQLSGSLSLQPGSSARIVGQHSGSLHVGADSVVEVVGSQSGSVHVERRGLVRVQPGGKLAGSLHVAGLIENRGTRGGPVQVIGGAVEDFDGGSVKEPTKSRDGANYYSW
jgi:hypothetical protein